MRRYLITGIRAAAILVLSTLLASFVVVAGEEASTSGGNISVVASVSPARYIIVDHDLKIQRILSNTKDEVRPSVLLLTADGEELPYTDSIRSQYASLKPKLDFSHPGEVYKRQQPTITYIVNSITGFFRSLFSWL